MPKSKAPSPESVTVRINKLKPRARPWRWVVKVLDEGDLKFQSLHRARDYGSLRQHYSTQRAAVRQFIRRFPDAAETKDLRAFLETTSSPDPQVATGYEERCIRELQDRSTYFASELVTLTRNLERQTSRVSECVKHIDRLLPLQHLDIAARLGVLESALNASIVAKRQAEKTPGQIAYEAYRDSLKGAGRGISTWEDVTDYAKNSWEAAAEAIASHYRTE
jgi:hypothetical protein